MHLLDAPLLSNFSLKRRQTIKSPRGSQNDGPYRPSLLQGMLRLHLSRYLGHFVARHGNDQCFSVRKVKFCHTSYDFYFVWSVNFWVFVYSGFSDRLKERLSNRGNYRSPTNVIRPLRVQRSFSDLKDYRWVFGAQCGSRLHVGSPFAR